MAVIHVKKLKYKYPHTDDLALNDLSFQIEPGELIGIIGENGAGKSTLCQAFSGLVPLFHKGAYGGEVYIDDMAVSHSSIVEVCQKVGLVFQNPFNQMTGAKETVFEEVAFGLQNYGVEKEEIIQRVNEVLELLDIDQYRDKNPFDLSGGQMQRVAIASILVLQPEIIVLDEPTSQLDPQGSDEVFKAIDVLTKKGMTVIIVEQKMEKIAEYCHRVLLMHQGKMIDFDTPEKVFSRDDLDQYGIQPPVYTSFARQFSIQYHQSYPVTLKQLESCLKNTKWHEKEGTLPSYNLNEKIFQVEDLTFGYENHSVLSHFHLDIDTLPTAIIGQNGAGKTTLVKLLKGLLKPLSGTIYYKGEATNHKTVAMLAGEIGYVFQNPDDQIFKYHVIDEVMFGPIQIGMKEEEARRISLEMLELVGLKDYANDNPYDLELNQRKLIAIASVLAMKTDVLILDEPTIAQDAKGKALIGSIVDKLKKEGKLVISILHDMNFAARYFERIIVMKKGQILMDGSKYEVFKNKEILHEAKLDQPDFVKLSEFLECHHIYMTLEEMEEALGGSFTCD